MQGSSVDYAVVNLGKLFADVQAYVPLRRIGTLDAFQIDELDCLKLTGTQPCNTDMLAEMQHLQNSHPAYS